MSPESLRSWYREFAGPEGRVVYLGEDPDKPALDGSELITEAGGGVVEFLSSHETLRRDRRLADRLQDAGIDARCQSESAIAAAVDKVVVKQLIEKSGVPTPRWGCGAPPPRAPSRVLLKQRGGTQSQGLAWADSTGDPGDRRYWEEYVEGVEFSVVLHREDRRTIVFPPVWKGATRSDLSPPWRRLRVCPLPLSERHLTGELIRMGRQVAELLDVWGFAEIEFIASGASPTVIEVNPRVSGTLRLVAMASGVRVFDHDELASLPGLPEAKRCAAELPYDGKPLLAGNVIATSRITCSAPTPQLVRHLMSKHVTTPASWPDEWAHD